MKFVLQRDGQQMVTHEGSRTTSSSAAVHLCLLGRWMHAEGRTVLNEVEGTQADSKLDGNKRGAPLMQADQHICTAPAPCHSHCIQGSCEVQEVNVQEGDLHNCSSLVGWSLPPTALKHAG